MKKESVYIQFLGCGDNFGAGGQLQSCILLEMPETKYLLDCGNTAMIGMRKFGVNPDEIDGIILTHLHGDHFGGIPVLILYEQFRKREKPLYIVGPEGTENRLRETMEVFYPGSTVVKRMFDAKVVELDKYENYSLNNLLITTYQAIHYSGADAFIVKIETPGKTVVYTGDTQWTDDIIEASRNADLLIVEAYFYEKKVRYHLDYLTIWQNRHRIKAKKILLTHLGEDMFANLDKLSIPHAKDGMKIIL